MIDNDFCLFPVIFSYVGQDDCKYFHAKEKNMLKVKDVQEKGEGRDILRFADITREVTVTEEIHVNM